ncbi:protein-disulfide reductase DsbD family protein [Palleronia rufa]|uniref:protein-disulfide reductase DsbD family protein n=1 Tax=Palleronia rufa TaxID=1530186 RepID=UPI0009DCB892|nr:protein-disulfide reductase DsbD domain-containing protein [Palleronia rufa]
MRRSKIVTRTWSRTVSAALAAGLSIAAALPSAVSAASSPRVENEILQARLLTAENGVSQDASTLSAGLSIDLAEGWKTYWRSPGEVGIPPSVDWSASENVADVEFYWPAPDRFRAFGIENFGYADQVTFPLGVTLQEPGAPARLAGTLDILVCSDICVPQTVDLALDLPAGSGGGIDTGSAEVIAAAMARVPDAARAGMGEAGAYLDADAETMVVTVRAEQPFAAPDVFPELGATTAFGAPDIRLGDGGRLLWAELPILARSDSSRDLAVTVTDGDRAATLTPAWLTAAPAPPFSISRAVPDLGALAWIALVAFLGGAILNVMPCVLPVLSIKMSSAMQARERGEDHVRRGFLMSALGVMTFMWALAAVLVALKAAGYAVGWGLQFQNPVFLSAMFLVLVLFAGNLFGAFEISLPQSWTTRLANAEARPGHSGDFATGAFAAILATPCSAPFLGTAVAFALAGRSMDVAVVFTALGLGLSLPYLALALRPGWVRRLPKPGRWMVAIRIVLGALLALTAAWLLWVLLGVAGATAGWLVAGLSALTLAILVLSSRMKNIVVAGTVALLGTATLAAPVLAPTDTAPAAVAASWTPFDRAEIPVHVSKGHVVFVDVTADWCLTCKANKTLVLDRGAVAQALAREDIIPMQADWTRPDPAISRYLESNGRYGIPFNAVYGPGAPEGIVLSEILSESAVLDAIAKAGRSEIALD